MTNIHMKVQLLTTTTNDLYIHVIGQNDTKEISIYFLVDTGKLCFSSATAYLFEEDKEIEWGADEESEFKASFPHLLENTKKQLFKDDKLVKAAGLHINTKGGRHYGKHI